MQGVPRPNRHGRVRAFPVRIETSSVEIRNPHLILDGVWVVAPKKVCFFVGNRFFRVVAFCKQNPYNSSARLGTGVIPDMSAILPKWHMSADDFDFEKLVLKN